MSLTSLVYANTDSPGFHQRSFLALPGETAWTELACKEDLLTCKAKPVQPLIFLANTVQ